MLQNKKILLGVTGGIAAYKAIELASNLSKTGAIVRTIMTDHAREFISPINFAAITHQKVYWDQWDINDPIAHISLADWADILVIAPSTANMIAKTAHGLSDDLLSTTILAFTKPILFVPAMNVNMYSNPIVQSNLDILRKRGIFCLDPDKGNLACGYEGKGRFPDIEEITYAIATYLEHRLDLKGKRILITAGGTIESIDPIRSITNRSSGKMGIDLARAAFLRGAKTTLVHANINEKVPYYLDSISVTSAEDMKQAVMGLYNDNDIIIMTAAVADFTPEIKIDKKIKKKSIPNINLKLTDDILYELGKIKDSNHMLIGFAAETENLEEYALDKLIHKNLDWIIANHINVSGKVNTEILMLSKASKFVASGSKFQVSHFILDRITYG